MESEVSEMDGSGAAPSTLVLFQKALIPSSLCFSSKKQLYLSLCPVLFDGGRKSFSLERESGKKCYMLSARDLFIVWSDIQFIGVGFLFLSPGLSLSLPVALVWFSRFEEVAKLINVCWFEIRGKITLSMLSPMTHYKAYLVFMATTGAYGFDFQPVEVSVGLVGTEGSKRTAYLGAERGRRQRYRIVPTRASDDQYPKAREDGWLEIELGEFFKEG
ncbi:hypothetical protein REPUB_Repub16aG0052200 [Reevesia pubescens]